MILIPAWLFTLLGAFAELVGREATAAIRRRQADEAKKERARKKREKAAAKVTAKREAKRKKLVAKREKEKEAERKRQEKSRRVQADLQKQIDGLCDPAADDNPYPTNSER